MSTLKPLDNTVISAAEYQAPSSADTKQRLRLTRSHWALIIAAIVCIAFMSFISVSRSIIINLVTPSLTEADSFTPIEADFELDNWLKLPLGNRLLVLPGSSNITVTAKGFQALQSELQIGFERHQQHQLVLTPLPGNLAITLTNKLSNDVIPPEFLRAEVTIDGQAVTDLPSFIENVGAGQREIVIDAPLYRSASATVVVQGKGVTQNLTMQLEPAWAQYSFSTEPENASLLVDGENFGNSPLTIKLEEGTRVITVQAEGFKDFVQEANVVAHEDLTIPTIKLIPADGVIEVQTQPSKAAVILNGEYRGVSPLQLKVAPNQAQHLQIYKAGYQLAEQNVTLQPAQVIDNNFELQQDRVPVSFSVSPQDAEIFIDGVRRGQGSQSIRLTTLPHKISIRRNGYVSYNSNLIPTRSHEQIVRARLLTKEQHFWQQQPNQYTNKTGHRMRLFQPPGTVRLGSSRRENGRRSNEVQYTAELTRHFYVSEFETTNKQFRAYSPQHSSGNYRGKSLDAGKQPVVNVSWQQAALYCNWLSKQENLQAFYTTKSGFVSGHNANANGYRLLSEVEWAFLARNGKGNDLLTYPWGARLEQLKTAGRVGNFGDKNAQSLLAFTLPDYNDGYSASAPVGKYPANHHGIYDLGGNVSEWVNDWYNAKGNLAANSASSKLNPLGPSEGEFHVVRGASWAKGHPPQLRLAYRDFGAKGKYDIGFRIARSVLAPAANN